MLNLSDELARFIEISFTDTQLPLIMDSFSMFERFSFQDYEDKYMDLIYDDENTDTVSRDQAFVNLIEGDLLSIVEMHGIRLSKDFTVSTAEFLDICSMLLLIPNLEDKSAVRYRALSGEDARTVFVQLLDRYTSITMLRAMDIVESVTEGLLDTIKELCGQEDEETLVLIDRNHRTYISKFFDFIKNSECLGLTYYEQGYATKVTTGELLELLTFSMDEYIDKLMLTKPEQAALDILSILIITKEEYELPLNKFKHLSESFTSTMTNVTRISHIMFNIMNDFGVYLEAVNQQEKIDGQNNN